MVIPMIGSYEEQISFLLASFIDLANLFVRGCYTHDGSLVYASMTYHVGGCEVVHQEFELLLANSLAQFVRHAFCTHWRIQIVCCHFGTGDKLSLLTSELFLHSAIEEKGDMSVFLGLSNVALLEALLAEPFRQHITHMLWWKGNGERVVGLVLSHGGDAVVLWVRKVRLRGAVNVSQQLGDLSYSVGAVVEKEQSVTVLHSAFFPSHNDGLQKLIVLAFRIPLLDGGNRICRLLALTQNDTLHTNLNTIPPLISIHNVVTAHHRCNLTAANL